MTREVRMMNRIKDVYLRMKQSETVVDVTELSEEFGISRKTVIRDLKVLEYNNLIKQEKRGKWIVL